MSWPRRRSDSGCSATRRSSSPTSSPCAAESEVRVDAILERGEAKLLEPTDLGLRPRLVGEVDQRRAAPQRERLPQAPGRDRRLRASSLRHEALEAVQIETVRLDAKLVARRPGDDHLVAEGLAELGDVRLQDLRRRRRRTTAQRSSISRSLDTGSLACSSRIARSARGLAASSATTRPSATASSGPSMRKSMAKARAETNTRFSTCDQVRCTGALPRLDRSASDVDAHQEDRKDRDAQTTQDASLGVAALRMSRRTTASCASCSGRPSACPDGASRRADARADRVRVHGSTPEYVVPAGICRLASRPSEQRGGQGGTSGAPGAGAQAVAGVRGGAGRDAAGKSGRLGRRRRSGRQREPAAGTVAAPAARRSTSAGKAGAGGGGATDVRRGGDRPRGPDHRRCRRIGRCRWRDRRPDRDRRRQRGRARRGRGSPSSGRRILRPAARAERRQREATRVETLRSLGHGDGRVARSRRPRRRRGSQRRRWRRRTGSTAAVAAARAAPSAAATAAAAPASARRDRAFGSGSAPVTGGRRSHTTPSLIASGRSHGDDDLPAGVALAEVAESVGRLAQLVAPVDDRLDLSRSRSAHAGAEIVLLDLRDEELDLLAPDHRGEPCSEHVDSGPMPSFDGICRRRRRRSRPSSTRA